MQGVAAFQERFVWGHTVSLKSELRKLVSNNRWPWNRQALIDMLGKQTGSFEAYMQDESETSYATFKDSQVACCGL